MSANAWKGRTVLITGHAGFKGGWLALYLAGLGAKVHGYGRARTAGPSFYDVTGLRRRLCSEALADMEDVVAVRATVERVRPDVVFHLAARAIVMESLEDPQGTIVSNVTGAANLLDAVRDTDAVTVMVTTDKVYRNRGRPCPFVETDALGGLDPYGASKAAVELITDSYRHVYGLRVATARCANVLGGGDWGPHRLLPNCLRAFDRGVPMRAYEAVRVFLHVLDAAAGYVALAEKLLVDGLPLAPAYNIGPVMGHSVPDVALAVAEAYGADSALVERVGVEPDQQASHLEIDSTLAREHLGWAPRWDLADTIARTIAWHRAWKEGGNMELVTQEQIREHDSGEQTP